MKPEQEFILDKQMSTWFLFERDQDGDRGEVLATGGDPVAVVKKYFDARRGTHEARHGNERIAIPDRAENMALAE